MSDDPQRWKAKYLESLEQQEKLEKRWDARLDLLRRGLVRSSLAAEGADKAVDQCMQELREIIRGEQMDAGLSALIPRLEKAVLDSEQRRQQRVEQSVSALTGLADRLLDLELPREVRKGLKQFAKRIDERARQPRELPALLAELGVLQGQALQAIASSEAAVARPGLLQRLFGGRDESPGEIGPVPSSAPAAPGEAALIIVAEPSRARARARANPFGRTVPADQQHARQPAPSGLPAHRRRRPRLRPARPARARLQRGGAPCGRQPARVAR